MYIKNSFFWNLIARHYAKQPIANQEAYQMKLNQTQAYLDKSSKVLEFGCGTGSTALYHAPKIDSILGIDISKNMIAIAQEKAKNRGLDNAEFLCTTLDQFNQVAESDSYDMIMAHSILHLVEDRNKDIRELSNLLKPNGYFISSTICMKDSFAFLKFFTTLGHLIGVLPLVKYFSQIELEKSFEDAGLTVLQSWKPGPKEATFIIAQKRD